MFYAMGGVVLFEKPHKTVIKTKGARNPSKLRLGYCNNHQKVIETRKTLSKSEARTDEERVLSLVAQVFTTRTKRSRIRRLKPVKPKKNT
jgi:hypothetical protein